MTYHRTHPALLQVTVEVALKIDEVAAEPHLQIDDQLQ